MKTIRIVFAVLLASAMAFNANAQVKKPVVKKPVVTTKAKPIVKKPAVVVAKPIPGIRVKLTTDSGIMIIRLYDSTPLHRDNYP